MKKILLMEDRTERQNSFLEEINLNLKNYENILENCINEKYISKLKELKNGSFSIEEYSLIIFHKSASEIEAILPKLEKYCKESQITLVLFSGEITANYYLKDDDSERMELSSATFYSENLKLFLEDCREENLNPLILSYGSLWKINILLNIREKLNNFIEGTEKDKVLYSVFIRDNPDMKLIDTLDVELYTIVEERKVSITEIIKLKESIDSYIKEYVENE